MKIVALEEHFATQEIMDASKSVDPRWRDPLSHLAASSFPSQSGILGIWTICAAVGSINCVSSDN
jgi:hypothetical protein